MNQQNENEVIMSQVVFTHITDKDLLESPLFKLNDLFLNYDNIPLETKQKNRFRVRFYALRFDP